jgi:hypothetical protein
MFTFIFMAIYTFIMLSIVIAGSIYLIYYILKKK